MFLAGLACVIGLVAIGLAVGVVAWVMRFLWRAK
jgi:hypothetical protein